MNNSWRTVLILLVIGLVAAMGLRAWLHPPLKLQAAQLLPEPKSIAGYELTMGATHVKFDMAQGRWVLIFLGYTECADVCPLELQKLAQMLKQFEASGAQQKPLVVFVSVDPERDTPDLLKTYAAFFHSEMQALTGSNSELAALAQFLGASYNRTTTIKGKAYLIQAGADMPAGSEKHYVVNHSSRIFIVDPQSHYVGSFAPPHDAAILYSDMQQLLNQ